MGIAMMIVMIFHQHFMYDTLFEPISRFGFWGVDVFLFVSGFGCTYSLIKGMNGKHWITSFYQRRFIRLMPAALLAGLLISPFQENAGWADYAGLSLWYIKALIVFYALAPFIYLSLRKMKDKIWLMVLFVAFIQFLYLYAILCIHELPFWDAYSLHLAEGRLPAFVLGMAVVVLNGNLKLSKAVWVCVALVALLLGEIAVICKNPFVIKGAYAYFILPALPLFCCICAILRKHMGETLVRAVEWVGKYSLELYLVHEFLYKKVMHFGTALPGCAKMVVGVSVSVACAYLLKQIVKLLLAGIGRVCAKFQSS